MRRSDNYQKEALAEVWLRKRDLDEGARGCKHARDSVAHGRGLLDDSLGRRPYVALVTHERVHGGLVDDHVEALVCKRVAQLGHVGLDPLHLGHALLFSRECKSPSPKLDSRRRGRTLYLALMRSMTVLEKSILVMLWYPASYFRQQS